MLRKFPMLLLLLIAIILLGGFLYLYTKRQPTPTKNQIAPTVTKALPSPTPLQTYCQAAAVQAVVTLSPGAGNVYGTFTLKNISNNTCQILGNEFITVNYDTSAVKNITVLHVGQTQEQPFTLTPGQELYSQVHFPNGPQCQSVGIHPTPVTFTYKISPTNTVMFSSPSERIAPVVQACSSPADMTEIKIWKMSPTPITPS